MSMLELLSQPAVWEHFYAYKTSLVCPQDIAKDLRRFIDEQKYLPVCEEIRLFLENPSGHPFPLPRKAVISKLSTQKKRIVYTYPPAENMVLKLLTYLLLRKYDGLFCDNLYSFRPGKSAADCIRKLERIPGLWQKYSYKVDVSNYFNSIPVPEITAALKNVLKDDPQLYRFLSSLLSEPRVFDGTPGADVPGPGEFPIITEQKGIMAGTPLASFYANLYLCGMDAWFQEQGIPYRRYSDDIIVFGDTLEEVTKYADIIRSFLSEKGLTVNPDKEEFRNPGQGFVFLGFSLKDGEIDIAPASVKKLKQKMRRKTRALQRWQKRNGLSGEKAAKAFIRIFNRKLLESSPDSDLSWSKWYFSVITTVKGLHAVDLYAQECVRVLLTGVHTKARYNARYEDLKNLGYQSLVHAYYSFSDKEDSQK